MVHMSYLYSWRSSQFRQARHEPTSADVIAVSLGLLEIFKYENGGFLRMRVTRGSLAWVPVGAAKLLVSDTGSVSNP